MSIVHIPSKYLTLGCNSPGDHAILEAEYQRNPKPDKAARTDIVRRVALNDKEVQVSLVLVAGMLIKAPNWLATRPEVRGKMSVE